MSEPAVFISAKSDDYHFARKVFEYLGEQGIASFFSDESLMQMGEADYKDAIDSAIDQVSHLVVVTSNRANAESKWVKYEWNSFANELLSGRKNGNLLTVACGALTAGDLPLALRQKQVLRFDSELHKLPRFLPGARRPEATEARASPAAAPPSALERLAARWLRPSWIGAMRHSRRAWVLANSFLGFICYAVICTGVGLTNALKAHGVPEFLAGLLGLALVGSAITLWLGAMQWLIQLRLPQSRYWWLTRLLGFSFAAQVCRTGATQLLVYILHQRWNLSGFWWDRLAAAGGLVVFGAVVGIIGRLYLKRYVPQSFRWMGYSLAMALPLNLIFVSGKEGLRLLGVPAAWTPMADILTILWSEPILAFGFWQLTRSAIAVRAESAQPLPADKQTAAMPSASAG